MTDTAVNPALPAPFTAAWSPASAQDDLRSWAAYLGEHGVTWSPQAERDLVDSVTRTSGGQPEKLIGMRLEKLANDTLSKVADARRVHREVATVGAQHWHLLTPEQRTAMEQTGVRFESSNAGLRQLATIPLTLGVYFGADYVCRSMGLSPAIAWVIALVVYVLTVRVVRGRWPLQPAR